MYHEDMENVIDLGHDHYLWFMSWKPDRILNTQYDGIPDIERLGATIEHKKADGAPCVGSLMFKSETQERVFPGRTTWTVLQEDPLTIDPSVMCSCGDHGYIRNGRWEPV